MARELVRSRSVILFVGVSFVAFVSEAFFGVKNAAN